MAPSLLALAAGGCGGDSGPSGPCLLVKVESVTPSPPSKVAAFFTVDKCMPIGEPVTGLTAANIQLKEDGTRLSAGDSQLQLVRNPDVFRVYTLAVLDLTGSIIRGDELPAVQDAARALVSNLTAQGTQNYVGIYTFDGRKTLQVQQGFTNDPSALDLAISRISSIDTCKTATDCSGYADHKTCALDTSGQGLCIDDTTNLYGAVIEGVTLLDSTLAAVPKEVFKVGTLVLVTDGADQAGLKSRSDAISKANGTSSSLYTVALGPDADKDFLGVLVKSVAPTALAATAADLTPAFSTIADKINQQAGRHYLLQYCSPKRAGSHELTITVQSEGATGEATSNFSAAGFSSGCSL